MAKQNKKVLIDSGELHRIERIKKLVIMAMFSDDELMDRFVLKGGNAIDLVLRAGSRASVDVDLSMADDFKLGELEDIRARIERNLKLTFQQEKYEVFDVKMVEKPSALTPDVAGFWGGYLVTFKLIEAAKFREIGENLEHLRRNAVMIGARGKFEIDISKFEYCDGKASHQMDGLQIFVYTPAMVVCEKLRAICQQMPAYGPVIHRTRPGSARARDFVDIHTLIEQFSLDLTASENRTLLKHVFEAKKVSLSLLGDIAQYREFHRPDFDAVKATIKAGARLEGFDFYFDYVVQLQARLKTFGYV